MACPILNEDFANVKRGLVNINDKNYNLGIFQFQGLVSGSEVRNCGQALIRPMLNGFFASCKAASRQY